jgi:hypothetical protein
MAISFYGGPKIVKGQLSNYRTGDSYTFTMNPESISAPFSANVSEDNIPGFSDPLVRFASGKVKDLKFKLKLSGEMRLRQYQRQFANGADGSTGLGDFNIKGEVDFLEAACSPTDPSLGGDGGLDRFVFTFGSRHPGVVVFVTSADVEEKRWDYQLNLTEAEVSITLKRIQDESVYASDIWRRS